MRLFLSSQDLGNHPEVAFKMCGAEKRVACILNAADDVSLEERADKLARKKTMFEEAGFSFEELDLREYFGKQAELAAKLKNIDFVWGNGGNTFILRRAMQASGFDSIIKKLLSRDEIMYGGSSAGSCVCAPSLRGIDRGDRPHPDAVPDGYPNKSIIWEGLNLVPFMIVPHCDQDWFEESANESIKALEDLGFQYIPLNDGEVVIIDGNKKEILK